MQLCFRWQAIALLAAMAVLSASSRPAQAVVLTTNGFEYTGIPETQFVGGNLAGQQGWKIDNPPGAPSPASTATVVNGIAATGTQSVQVERKANSDRRWALPVSGQPTGSHVVISWDMRVELSDNDDVYGPLFGVEAWDSVGALALIGSVFVDGSTGDILYQAPGTGYIAEVGVPAVTSLAWNHFDLVLDFSTDSYSIFLNNSEILTEDFVDKHLGVDGINEFTDADIAAIAGHPDSLSNAATGMAWFDNFVVRNSLLAGDFNGDDVVDALDYVTWRNALGNVGLQEAADGNFDGVVDHLDYLVWKADYIAAHSGALVLSPAQVPEPATVGLMLVGGVALAWRLRHGRRGGE